MKPSALQMSIPLLERSRYDYIYIDHHNHVHFFIPLVGGETIGTDNTCQSLKAIKRFFGEAAVGHVHGHSGSPSQAERALGGYIKDLTHDIAILKRMGNQYQSQLQGKQQRLKQLEDYYKLWQEQVMLDRESLNNGHYPSAIYAALKDKKRNAGLISLSTLYEDNAGPIGAAAGDSFDRRNNAIFSVARGVKGQKFGPALRAMWQRVTLVKADLAKDRLIALAQKKYEEKSKALINDDEALNQVKDCIAAAYAEIDQDAKFQDIRKSLDEKVDPPSSWRLSQVQVQALNFNYFKTILAVDEGQGIEVQDAIQSLVNSVFIDETFARLDKELSPFACPSTNKGTTGHHFHQSEISEPERLSICTQLFLATVNAYCYSQGHKSNFGQILEEKSNSKLMSSLIETIQSAFKNTVEKDPVETSVLNFTNNHGKTFKIKALSEDERQHIIATFKHHYCIIQKSPHFDEFVVLLPDAKEGGDFYSYQGQICLHASAYLRHKSRHAYKQYYTGQSPNLVCTVAVEEKESKGEARPSRYVLPGTNAVDSIRINVDLMQVSCDELASVLMLETDGMSASEEVKKEKDQKEEKDHKGIKPASAAKRILFSKWESITQIQDRKDWVQVRNAIVSKLPEEEINEFEKLSGSHVMHISNAMESVLYSAATYEKGSDCLLGYAGVDKLGYVLNLLELKYSNIIAHEAGGYAVVVENESCKLAIQQRYETAKNGMHITRSMARSLYLAAKSRSFDIPNVGVHQAHDRLAKVLKDMGIIGLEVNSNSGDGFFVKSNNKQEAKKRVQTPDPFLAIRDIYSRYYSSLLKIKLTKEECLKICRATQDPGNSKREVAAVTIADNCSPHQLCEAFTTAIQYRDNHLNIVVASLNRLDDGGIEVTIEDDQNEDAKFQQGVSRIAKVLGAENVGEFILTHSLIPPKAGASAHQVSDEKHELLDGKEEKEGKASDMKKNSHGSQDFKPEQAAIDAKIEKLPEYTSYQARSVKENAKQQLATEPMEKARIELFKGMQAKRKELKLPVAEKTEVYYLASAFHDQEDVRASLLSDSSKFVDYARHRIICTETAFVADGSGNPFHVNCNNEMWQLLDSKLGSFDSKTESFDPEKAIYVKAMHIVAPKLADRSGSNPADAEACLHMEKPAVADWVKNGKSCETAPSGALNEVGYYRDAYQQLHFAMEAAKHSKIEHITMPLLGLGAYVRYLHDDDKNKVMRAMAMALSELSKKLNNDMPYIYLTIPKGFGGESDTVQLSFYDQAIVIFGTNHPKIKVVQKDSYQINAVIEKHNAQNSTSATVVPGSRENFGGGYPSYWVAGLEEEQNFGSHLFHVLRNDLSNTLKNAEFCAIEPVKNEDIPEYPQQLDSKPAPASVPSEACIAEANKKAIIAKLSEYGAWKCRFLWWGPRHKDRAAAVIQALSVLSTKQDIENLLKNQIEQFDQSAAEHKDSKSRQWQTPTEVPNQVKSNKEINSRFWQLNQLENKKKAGYYNAVNAALDLLKKPSATSSV